MCCNVAVILSISSAWLVPALLLSLWVHILAVFGHPVSSSSFNSVCVRTLYAGQCSASFHSVPCVNWKPLFLQETIVTGTLILCECYVIEVAIINCLLAIGTSASPAETVSPPTPHSTRPYPAMNLSSQSPVGFTHRGPI